MDAKQLMALSDELREKHNRLIAAYKKDASSAETAEAEKAYDEAYERWKKANDDFSASANLSSVPKRPGPLF